VILVLCLSNALRRDDAVALRVADRLDAAPPPGVEVRRTAVFVDNSLLVRGNPTGERLAKVAKRSGMLLMGCDPCCCCQRAIADRLIDGIPIGCVPDPYKALGGAEIDQVITL
jgi:hypothetical protein